MLIILFFHLFLDPTSTPIIVDMKANEGIPIANQDVIDSNIIIIHTDEKKVEIEISSVVNEQSSEIISTDEDNISTETNVAQQNSNEILTLQTDGSIQTSIYSIQNDIENSGNKEVCVDNSNIEKGCEKIDYDNIKIVVESSVDVVEENVADGILNADSCSDDSHASVKVDTSQSQNIGNVGSGNECEVSDVSLVDSTNNDVKPSYASDLESGKSTDSSPSTKKKKVKPMSASMQRLTAKKESPDFKRSTDLLSAAERKAKADELRKRKISEQRNKDDERRAAVLERKRKLEDAEREKKEALFKKLTTKDPEKPLGKQSPMKKRYSLSTSNLSQLKKNKLVEVKVDLNATTVPKRTEYKPKERVKLTERPRSAMQKSSMGVPSQKTKHGTDAKRPMTAFGLRTSFATTKAPKTSRPPPKPNMTQPARPATALGISTADKRKSLPAKHLKTEKPVNTGKAMQKSKSSAGLASKEVKKTVPGNTSEKKTNQLPEKKKLTTQAPVKKALTNDSADKKKEKEKPPKASAPSKEKTGSSLDDLPPRKKMSSSKSNTKKRNKTNDRGRSKEGTSRTPQKSKGRS